MIVRVASFAASYPFPPLAKDDSVYDALGWNLLNGNGFSGSPAPPYEPLAYRTPGYPVFLAVTYAVAGHRTDAVRVLQILLSLATLVFVALLARRLMSRGAALVATLAYALCPAAVLYPSLMLTEANQALLVALSLWLAYRAADNPRIRWFVALALVLAAAALCRPDYLFLIVPLTAGMWLVGRRGPVMARGICIALLCFAAALSPWLYRTYRTFGVLGLATGTGHTMISAKLEAEGKTGPTLYRELEQRYGSEFEAKYGRRMTYIDGARPDQDALRRHEVVEFIKADPITYATQAIARIADLWQPRSWSNVAGLNRDFSEYRSDRQYALFAVKGTLLAVDALMIVLALAGVAFALLQWRRFALLLVPICYASVIHGLVYSGSRYRVPLMPVVVLLATYGFLQVYLLLQNQSGPHRSDGDWQLIAGDDSKVNEPVAL
jgi:4-amino-4-deoxy-L-arabinose transferase-like glycosyltransferase